MRLARVCSWLLVVAGLAVLGPGSGTADEKAPVVTQVVTEDGHVYIGEVLKETDEALNLLDLKTGKEVAIPRVTVRSMKRDLSQEEAVRLTGLAPYVAWRVKLAQEVTPKGQIVTVSPTAIYVNLGQRDGIEVGEKLKVYRKGEALTDPKTGEALGELQSLLGELEVTEVQDKFAKAKRTTEIETDLERGDTVELVRSKRPVAVLPVVAANPDLTDMAREASQRWGETLVARGVPVVERAQLDKAVAELALPLTGLVDPDTASKLGKLLGAYAVLTGSAVLKEPGVVTLYARLIKVQTGEVVVAASEQVALPRKEMPAAPATARAAAVPAVGPAAIPAAHAGGPAPRIALNLGDGGQLPMVLIPAGEFDMGSPDAASPRGDDEVPRHRVRITKAFYMGVTPVTQRQWEAVMGTRPWGNSPVDRQPDGPAIRVNWHDATAFCQRLAAATGMTVDLPTEAEWEYACRAGTDTTYSFGSDPAMLGEYAWFRGNASYHTNPVGRKKPNAWGLYDLHGSVWQWCKDWWHPGYYSQSPSDDPVCNEPAPGLRLQFRVLRGGSWAAPAEDCRSANREIDTPDHANLVNGFRIVVRP